MLTGNREFNESYENYKNLILRTAYTYSGNREAAEDITQETFLKLYIGYDSMKKENIPSWLYTTAKNMALNYKKKAKWEVLAMGVNLRTLHSLLHRAKNWIKKNYKVEYEEMNRED